MLLAEHDYDEDVGEEGNGELHVRSSEQQSSFSVVLKIQISLDELSTIDFFEKLIGLHI